MKLAWKALLVLVAFEAAALTLAMDDEWESGVITKNLEACTQEVIGNCEENLCPLFCKAAAWPRPNVPERYRCLTPQIQDRRRDCNSNCNADRGGHCEAKVDVGGATSQAALEQKMREFDQAEASRASKYNRSYKATSLDDQDLKRVLSQQLLGCLRQKTREKADGEKEWRMMRSPSWSKMLQFSIFMGHSVSEIPDAEEEANIPDLPECTTDQLEQTVANKYTDMLNTEKSRSFRRSISIEELHGLRPWKPEDLSDGQFRYCYGVDKVGYEEMGKLRQTRLDLDAREKCPDLPSDEDVQSVHLAGDDNGVDTLAVTDVPKVTVPEIFVSPDSDLERDSVPIMKTPDLPPNEYRMSNKVGQIRRRSVLNREFPKVDDVYTAIEASTREKDAIREKELRRAEMEAMIGSPGNASSGVFDPDSLSELQFANCFGMTRSEYNSKPQFVRDANLKKAKRKCA